MYLFFVIIFALTLSGGTVWAQESTPAQETSTIQETAIQTQEQVATPQAKQPPAPEASSPKCLSGIELLTGFGWGKLRVAKRNYNAIPFMLDLDFDLKPLLNKINIKPRFLVQGVIEPYASFITSPESNVEIGNAFLIKIGFLPETSKIQPYFKGGAGMTYISLHTHEQGTQFNFIEYGGLGAHYYFTKDTAFTLEGRFRHLSNAGIGSPNTGINSYFVVSGITKKF